MGRFESGHRLLYAGCIAAPPAFSWARPVGQSRSESRALCTLTIAGLDEFLATHNTVGVACGEAKVTRAAVADRCGARSSEVEAL